MSSTEQEKKVRTKLQPFMPKFQIAFDKSNKTLQDLFLDLVDRFAKYPITQKTVNRPDYRFSKNVVFCAIVPQPKKKLFTGNVESR